MDIQLPDINGIELTKKMKAINPEVPIIAQTAFASEYDKAKCLEAGCDNYITKPIEKQAMMELIDSYLNEIIIN